MTTTYDPDSEAALETETLALFAALGWEPANALAESAGNCPITGRATTGDVVLVHRLRAALARLNVIIHIYEESYYGAGQSVYAAAA